MTRADQLHRQAQKTLQDQVGSAVARTLLTVTLDRSEQVRDVYRHGTARLVSGGQLAAAQLATAYLAAYVPSARPVDLPRALEPVAMTVDSPGAVVGLLRLWSLLDKGVPEPQARTEAAGMAANLARGDMQAAQRAGLKEAARAAGRKPRWRKELSPGACEWCQEIAAQGAVYPDAETVPFHNSDSCGVAPEFEEE